MSDHKLVNLNAGEETSIQPDWHCQFCKDVSKIKELEEEPPPFWWGIGGDFSKTQKFLAKKLESRPVHIIVVLLVCLDLLLIIIDLSLSSFYPNEEEAPEAVRTVESVFAWTSVGILSVFALEQLAKLVVFGPRYFLKFWHALDAFIIIASLVLEIVLRKNQDAREVASLLIIFRLWRLVRIMHGVVEVSLQHTESLEMHHQLEWKMQQRINELEKQLNLPPSQPMTLKNSDLNSDTNKNSTENGLLHDAAQDIV